MAPRQEYRPEFRPDQCPPLLQPLPVRPQTNQPLAGLARPQPQPQPQPHWVYPQHPDPVYYSPEPHHRGAPPGLPLAGGMAAVPQFYGPEPYGPGPVYAQQGSWGYDGMVDPRNNTFVPLGRPFVPQTAGDAHFSRGAFPPIYFSHMEPTNPQVFPSGNHVHVHGASPGHMEYQNAHNAHNAHNQAGELGYYHQPQEHGPRQGNHQAGYQYSYNQRGSSHNGHFSGGYDNNGRNGNGHGPGRGRPSDGYNPDQQSGYSQHVQAYGDNRQRYQAGLPLLAANRHHGNQRLGKHRARPREMSEHEWRAQNAELSKADEQLQIEQPEQPEQPTRAEQPEHDEQSQAAGEAPPDSAPDTEDYFKKYLDRVLKRVRAKKRCGPILTSEGAGARRPGVHSATICQGDSYMNSESDSDLDCRSVVSTPALPSHAAM